MYLTDAYLLQLLKRSYERLQNKKAGIDKVRPQPGLPWPLASITHCTLKRLLPSKAKSSLLMSLVTA